MKRIYLITGAAGHLGNTILCMLAQQDPTAQIRVLLLPKEKEVSYLVGNVTRFVGDVRDCASMEAFFSINNDTENIVIHCAGVISIASKFNQLVYDVNVTGTKNIIAMCETHAVSRLLYVSSVHAIKELPRGQVITETTEFDADSVVGLYAKTKAEATKEVLSATKRGLPVIVVHPSGIIGPYDYGHGHLTQLILDSANGTLPAGMQGGYDFVDVRDVAEGILSCLQSGKVGSCYLLTNQYYSIPVLLQMIHEECGTKRVKLILPYGFVKCIAPLTEFYYKVRKQTPLFTAYSIYTLNSNALFSHKQADQELGYTTRNIRTTIRDTYQWLKQEGRITV